MVKYTPNGVMKYFAEELGLNAIALSCSNNVGIKGRTFLTPPIISPLSEILKNAPKASKPTNIEAESCFTNFTSYDSIPFWLQKLFSDNGESYEVSVKISDIRESWETYDVAIKAAKNEEKSKLLRPKGRSVTPQNSMSFF